MKARTQLTIREYYDFIDLSKKYRFKWSTVAITGTYVIIAASREVLKAYGYVN